MKTIQDLIRAAKRRGLTQAKLAELLGVQQPHISRWLHGTRRPRRLTLLGIEAIIRKALAAKGKR